MTNTFSIDPLGFIFNDDTIKQLQNKLQRPFKSESERERLLTRLNILTVSGEIPRSVPDWKAYTYKFWRAQKAAWDNYLYAAYMCGLFEGATGRDLISRLRSPDNNNFQGAIAECLTAWIFLAKFKLPTQPRPPGNSERPLELLISGNIFVEVKAPYRPAPNQVWSGDDADKIEHCLEEACEQFKPGKKNLLVIVPSLRLRLYGARGSLIRAFYVEEQFVMDFDPTKGAATGPARLEHAPKGHFLKVWGKEDKPRFTRVSGVLSIEEKFNERYLFMDHNLLLLHNPHAQEQISDLELGDFPVFKQFGDVIRWSDGAKLFP